MRSFKFPKREKMEELREQWIEECVKQCGYMPEGNVDGREWGTASRDAQVSEIKTL